MSNELGLEDEFVLDRLGRTHRAIEVFRTGEFQGTHNERLRIIKLLEGQECGNDRCYCTFYSSPDRHCKFVSELIALIKGEQK